MKKIVVIFIILIFILLGSAFAAEERDFGLRIDSGVFNGIGSITQYGVGIGLDFNFLSEDLRMTFGTTFLIPRQGYTSVTTLHYIGIEYNMNCKKNIFLIGINYIKSNPLKIRNDLNGKRGYTYYVGYKRVMNHNHDIVLQIGSMSQPFKRTIDDPNFPLKNRSPFFRFGTEWYI